jgi:hypothetical protein
MRPRMMTIVQLLSPLGSSPIEGATTAILG